MSYVLHLKCILCGSTFKEGDNILTCPNCGDKGVLDVIYDYNKISKAVNRESIEANKEISMWRYMPFLPVEPDWAKPPLRIGWTPLYNAERLASEIGVRTLFVKDEGVNPTASMKDRASAIAVRRAYAAGKRIVACASTGNAASSLAGSAASIGLRSCIFVPRRAPRGKLMQLLIYGATVVSVEGSYHDAFSLSAEAINKWGWYNRNAAINPFLLEGKKTVSFEICEQLNWEVPDWVVVAVGDGCTIGGVYKGFYDFYSAGLIPGIPKILGVQAAGCQPLVKAFFSGKPFEPSEENTIADSIAVGVPRNPVKALDAVKLSHGTMIAVSDEEILEAMPLLGKTTGVFTEPAGAASLAGLRAALKKGYIDAGESVVMISTGNGLKDIVNAQRAAAPPIEVLPSVKELENNLRVKAPDLLKEE
ncbi:MAG: threonine synthase [Firmicutes bacterium]|nr:threonine synthase [Bacillota bacterium]HXL03597.1 threonine synthase [Bacillota bacterium]